MKSGSIDVESVGEVRGEGMIMKGEVGRAKRAKGKKQGEGRRRKGKIRGEGKEKKEKKKSKGEGESYH